MTIYTACNEVPFAICCHFFASVVTKVKDISAAVSFAKVNKLLNESFVLTAICINYFPLL